MAVCLSVGPGQGGSWIKAFQQIVSIISLLLLPLPNFFTIPAPARFLLRVSLHLVAAPTVALFQKTPVWEISSSCSWIWNGLLMCLCGTWYLKCQRQTRSFKESKDWWRITMMPKKMMGKFWKWCSSLTLHHSFYPKSELDLIMMMKIMMTMVATYKSLSPLPSLSERTGLIIPVGHFHLPSLPLCFA